MQTHRCSNIWRHTSHLSHVSGAAETMSMGDGISFTSGWEQARRYERVREIGVGMFGFVELAVDLTTGENVAIKYLERGKKITKHVEREVFHHSCLKHPHIVQFKEVFLTPRYLALAMEFVPGTDLFRHIQQRGRLEESAARWFFQQLILAVDYLHAKGVASRDIKAENLLLDNSPRPLLKICDFGFSTNKVREAASKVGTVPYMAPEVILASENSSYDAKLADVWSCGVLLYVLLVGEYPFGASSDEEDVQRLRKVIKRIRDVEFSIPPHVPLTDGCRNLLRRALVADPHSRITIFEIQRHPWFQEDLPLGALQLNQGRSFPPDRNQEIARILREAREPISKSWVQ